MRRLLPLALVLFAVLASAGPAAAITLAPEDRGAIVVIAGDVEVSPVERAAGVYVVSGDVDIDGRVDGDVVVVSGDVTIAGAVTGDVITISGTAHLLPSAVVGGDVRYSENRPEVSGDARVVGDVEKQDWDDLGGALPILGFFLLWLAVGVSAAVLGLFLVALAPAAADSLYARSRERVGPTIAIGIAIGIGLPLAAVLAAVTILGIPLAIAILLAILPVFGVAYVVSAWALGRRLLGPPRHRLLSVLVGVGVLRAVALVPVLGGLVGLAAVIFGLGLIGAALGRARSTAATPPDGPAQIL